MRRFAILRHDFPFLHWDFLLETGGVAECWRLFREPCVDEPIATERLADHRLMYLDYEGPVSQGRGVVRAVLRGLWLAQEFTMNLSETESIQLTTADSDAFRFAQRRLSSQDRPFWYFSASAAESECQDPAVL
jgi:DNA polymerase Ligase (LigD)